MRTADLFNFIYERHRVYQRRKSGLPKPWTDDPIIQQYRFCNVYRELDTVTKWIADNWRTPNQDDKNLWFALVVARLFNTPATLTKLGYPKRFDPDTMLCTIAEIEATGKPVFSPAYIVSTNHTKMKKAPYLVERVLIPMWEPKSRQMMTWAHKEGDSLEEIYDVLCGFNGLGSFLAAQVIADLKYANPYLGKRDWWTFAKSGPGSRRGLNRVLGRDTNAPWNEDAWYDALTELSEEIAPHISKAKMPRLYNQDLQNCLCEFDKYERVRLGEGTPKQRYKGV